MSKYVYIVLAIAVVSVSIVWYRHKGVDAPTPNDIVIGNYEFSDSRLWIKETPDNQDRIVQIRIPQMKGDLPQDLILSGYIGSSNASENEAQVQRWLFEFVNPAGGSLLKTIDEVDDVRGVKIHLRGVSGTMHMAAAPGNVKPMFENWGMLVAEIKGNKSTVLVRVIGPKMTIDERQSEVVNFLKTCRIVS